MPSPETILLRDLGLIVVCAALFAIGARAIRMPSIVAYLLAGLALGPLAGLLIVTETLELISEAGIALLLFLVGLELSFDKIRRLGQVAVVAGLGQVAFTAAGGVALCLALGFGLVESIFIATALTFSSTVLVVKLLDQKRELDTLYGRIAVGIFLVQDLVVIVALTLLAGLGQLDELALGSVLIDLLEAFGGMAILLGGALLASRYALPPLFGWISRSLEAMFIWSLGWCFLLVIGAERLGLSIEIGAFLAGISLAQLPYNQELRRRVRPLMNFFIAVFFVTLGSRMQPVEVAGHWPAATVLSLFVLIGNPLIFIFIIARLGYSETTAFLTGVTVAQISEFSFVFAALGVRSGLVDESVLALVTMIGLVTIGASAYMILYNHQLFALVRRWGLLRPFRAAVTERDVAPPDLRSGHVIVVGVNALGRSLVQKLARRSERVLAVDTDPRKLAGLPADTLLGNVDDPAVLEEAAIDRAKLVISALQIEDTNNLLAFRCRERGVPCAIHAFDSSVVRELREIGVDHLIFSKHAGLRQIAEELRTAGLIGA